MKTIKFNIENLLKEKEYRTNENPKINDPQTEVMNYNSFRKLMFLLLCVFVSIAVQAQSDEPGKINKEYDNNTHLLNFYIFDTIYHPGYQQRDVFVWNPEAPAKDQISYAGWEDNKLTVSVYIGPNFTPAQRAEIQSAINRWNAENCVPALIPSVTSPADIEIRRNDALGGGGVSDIKGNGAGEITEVDIEIDTDGPGTPPPPPPLSVEELATHELGHALGLDHTNNPDDVMKPKGTNGTNGDLSDEDKKEIRQASALAVAALPLDDAEAPAVAMLPGGFHVVSFDLSEYLPDSILAQTFAEAYSFYDSLVYVYYTNIDSTMLSVMLSCDIMHPNSTLYLGINLYPPQPYDMISFIGYHYIHNNPADTTSFECPFTVLQDSVNVYVNWTQLCTYPFNNELRSQLVVDDTVTYLIKEQEDYTIQLDPGIHTLELFVNDFQVNSASYAATINVSGTPTGGVSAQSINMPLGWSIMSTYLEPDTSDLEYIFASIVSSIMLVKDGSGSVYWPGFGLNMIGNLTIGEGYQVNLTSNETLNITGTPVAPELTPFLISAGWSIIGYLRDNPMNITTIFDQYSGSLYSQGAVELVKNGNGDVYWPFFGYNGIGDMVPGEGYQINMNSAELFTYPANSYGSTKNSFIRNQPEKYIDLIKTGNNMSLGIPADAWVNVPEAGDEIGVFNMDGKLVGSTVYTDGFNAISIWGNDETNNKIDGQLQGEAFTIRHFSHRANLETELKVISWIKGDNIYHSNKISVVGEIAPASENNNLSLVLEQNYPNPFREYTEIEFYLPVDCVVVLEVFNLLGDQIALLINDHLTAGSHKYTFDSSEIPPGNYFYRLMTPKFDQTRKMVRIE